MKAYVLLGVAIAIPALAQSSTDRSVEDATRFAIEACANHSSGSVPIEGKSGSQFDAKGLKYQLNPPEFLASTKMTTLGKGEYLKSPSTEGEIWAIGYDSGGCMVIALAAPTAEVEKGLVTYFTQTKGWRSDRPTARARPGERLIGYAWNPRRNLKLVVAIGLRDAENTTTVTITRSNG
ncbi:MAG TPA: hypothetical protein VGE65_04160 [Sphingobium sp.]